MLSIDELLLKTGDELHENFKKHVKECNIEVSLMVNRLNILDGFIENIIPDIDAKIILEEVSYDLLASIYITGKGMYRNGYISIRSAIELGLSFFYFLEHNYDFLKWKKNKFDISWTRLNDPNNGVITNDYLNLFDESFESEDFINNIKRIYRECSQYVHGKYEYMHCVKIGKISFDIDKFREWSNIFVEAIDIILILIAIRFKDRLIQYYSNDFDALNDIFKNMGLKEMNITHEY